jgi:hypothetical protein
MQGDIYPSRAFYFPYAGVAWVGPHHEGGLFYWEARAARGSKIIAGIAIATGVDASLIFGKLVLL